MPKRIVILTLAALLTVAIPAGFAATMVVTSDDAEGVQEGPRWGILKYLNEGTEKRIQARQKKARKKMKRFCAKQNYRVVGERDRRVTELHWIWGRTWEIAGPPIDQRYLFVKFECIE